MNLDRFVVFGLVYGIINGGGWKRLGGLHKFRKIVTNEKMLDLAKARLLMEEAMENQEETRQP